MKWYPVINRHFQNLGRDIRLQNMPVRTELGRQIIDAFAPKVPFTIDCDYPTLEWNTLVQKEPT